MFFRLKLEQRQQFSAATAQLLHKFAVTLRQLALVILTYSTSNSTKMFALSSLRSHYGSEGSRAAAGNSRGVWKKSYHILS
ncbi:hypothetical protein Baya_8014 [Bagarius yarrelli]|uniref:Uncharacterized protein n=1 Tax=Bagarius yarrelli TaxID=175774 RepID=A0A556U425_BAGYA|nr:hypothetical protein Baya_8014 [Bagarius yarrelli]